MLAFAKDNQEPQPKVTRAGPAGEPTGGLPAQGLSLVALAKQRLPHPPPPPSLHHRPLSRGLHVPDGVTEPAPLT